MLKKLFSDNKIASNAPIAIFTLLLVDILLLVGMAFFYIKSKDFIIFLVIVLLILLFFVFLLILLYILFFKIQATASGAPFASTPIEIVEEMLDLAEVDEAKTVLDVGSGDGRIVCAAAARGASAVGIEIQPYLYWLSKSRVAAKCRKKGKIIRKNFWKYSFSKFDVATLFFIPHKMDKLAKKIKKEMKPGSVVVSYDFTFPNWKFEKKHGKVYLYRV